MQEYTLFLHERGPTASRDLAAPKIRLEFKKRLYTLYSFVIFTSIRLRSGARLSIMAKCSVFLSRNLLRSTIPVLAPGSWPDYS
jgi:hypothetical protein